MVGVDVVGVFCVCMSGWVNVCGPLAPYMCLGGGFGCIPLGYWVLVVGVCVGGGEGEGEGVERPVPCPSKSGL